MVNQSKIRTGGGKNHKIMRTSYKGHSQVDTLCHSTNIDTMRAVGKSVGSDETEKRFAEKFFRKGTVGNWTEYFEGGKLDEFNKWIEDNLKGTDITIPFK